MVKYQTLKFQLGWVLSFQVENEFRKLEGIIIADEIPGISSFLCKLLF
jgi:hypothetical protein